MTFKQTRILFFFAVAISAIAVITIPLMLAAKSDRDIALEAEWYESLSIGDSARMDYTKNRFLQKVDTQKRGANGLYTVTKNSKTRVELIVQIRNKTGLVIKTHPIQIGMKTRVLDNRFLFTVGELYYPGEEGHAKLALQFSVQ